MAVKPILAAGLDTGSRTTRLTVIDDTPASLATADRVGAECGSLGGMGLIRQRLANSGRQGTICLV